MEKMDSSGLLPGPVVNTYIVQEKYCQVFVTEDRDDVFSNSQVLFPGKWTSYNAWNTCEASSESISASTATPMSSNRNFVSGCFHLVALPNITLLSSEHDTLGELRTKRRNFFTSTENVRNLSSKSALSMACKNSMKRTQLMSKVALALFTAIDIFKWNKKTMKKVKMKVCEKGRNIKKWCRGLWRITDVKVCGNSLAETQADQTIEI